MSDFPLSAFGEIVFAKWNYLQLKKHIERLQKEFPRRICRKALAELAKTSVKKIKATIPGRVRGIRKAIKWRHKKARYSKYGPEVKVGAGVGKQKQTAGEATTTKNRKGRPGVGFDARNIHWWFLGTDKRYTGTKRVRRGGKKGRGGWRGSEQRVDTGKPKKYRGRMPPQGKPIIVTLTGASGELLGIVRKWIDVGIKQELK